MANVLSEEKRQQVVALGRLGWSLRRIQSEAGVRRETASRYLRAAGIPVRRSGGQPSVWPPKPATVVDDAAKAALDLGVPTYRFLRRYIDRKPPVTLRQIDPLIRQLELYRDVITRKTGDPT